MKILLSLTIIFLSNLTNASLADLEQNLMKVRQIKKEIQLNETLFHYTKSFTEKRKEIITNSYKKKMGAKVGGLFGLLGLKATASARWDVSKIITTNPQQVEKFKQDTANELYQLKEKLVDYIDKNLNRIVEMKKLNLDSLDIMIEMTMSGENVPAFLLEELMVNSQELSFYGAQTVTACIKTSFAKKLSQENVSGGFNLLGIISGGGHYESKSRQNKYSEKKCQSTINTVKVDASETIGSLRLDILDYQVEKRAEELAAIVSLQALNGSYDVHTFGNPYYENN